MFEYSDITHGHGNYEVFGSLFELEYAGYGEGGEVGNEHLGHEDEGNDTKLNEFGSSQLGGQLCENCMKEPLAWPNDEGFHTYSDMA